MPPRLQVIEPCTSSIRTSNLPGPRIGHTPHPEISPGRIEKVHSWSIGAGFGVGVVIRVGVGIVVGVRVSESVAMSASHPKINGNTIIMRHSERICLLLDRVETQQRTEDPIGPLYRNWKLLTMSSQPWETWGNSVFSP